MFGGFVLPIWYLCPPNKMFVFLRKTRQNWVAPPPCFCGKSFWRIWGYPTPPHPLYLSLLWTFGKKTFNSFDSFGFLKFFSERFKNFAIVGLFGSLPVRDQFWREVCGGFPHKQCFVVAISIKHFVHKCASEDVKVTTIYLISQDHIDECSNVVACLIKR